MSYAMYLKLVCINVVLIAFSFLIDHMAGLKNEWVDIILGGWVLITMLSIATGLIWGILII